MVKVTSTVPRPVARSRSHASKSELRARKAATISYRSSALPSEPTLGGQALRACSAMLAPNRPAARSPSLRAAHVSCRLNLNGTEEELAELNLERPQIPYSTLSGNSNAAARGVAILVAGSFFLFATEGGRCLT